MKKYIIITIVTVCMLIFGCEKEEIVNGSSSEEAPVVTFENGWKSLNVNFTVKCGIFQFDDADNNYVHKEINKQLMAEFDECVSITKKKALGTLTQKQEPMKIDGETKKVYSDTYHGEVRGITQVLLNNGKTFSAINDIFLMDGMGASLIKEGFVFRIKPNGEIKKIELQDLFEKNSNWLESLLITAIDYLEKSDRMWENPEKIKDEIRCHQNKSEYISSFAFDGTNLVLIFHSLSIMPNVGGMPIVKIPVKNLKYFTGFQE